MRCCHFSYYSVLFGVRKTNAKACLYTSIYMKTVYFKFEVEYLSKVTLNISYNELDTDLFTYLTHTNLQAMTFIYRREIHSKKMTSHKYILDTLKIQKLSLKSIFFPRGKYNLDLQQELQRNTLYYTYSSVSKSELLLIV